MEELKKSEPLEEFHRVFYSASAGLNIKTHRASFVTSRLSVWKKENQQVSKQDLNCTVDRRKLNLYEMLQMSFIRH